MSNTIVEIVTFRPVAGLDEKAVLKLAATADAFLERQPGFLARRLSVGADGTWLEHIEWTRLKHAEAAASAFMTEPGLAAFRDAIDPARVAMHHNRLLHALG